MSNRLKGTQVSETVKTQGTGEGASRLSRFDLNESAGALNADINMKKSSPIRVPMSDQERHSGWV